MPPGDSIIKVAIIEDQRVLREGLAFLLDGTEGFRCTGSFGSVEQALSRISDDLPQVALVDIGLPGMSGIEGIRIMKGRWPDLLLITLTIYEDDEKIFDALCAGASGYLLKRTPPARLVESLNEVVNGGAPMSPEVARRVITLFNNVAPPGKVDYRLTPHEIRLLKMLVEGHSYKTAAAELGSSINTIGTHMQSIYRKLQVHSKSEAVVKALRNRLV
ncbi:MAG: response regulator transcription factor [Blastocatellia bacterium]|nr:response regulator transcription factor [Blastocatellia bacterium]